MLRSPRGNAIELRPPESNMNRSTAQLLGVFLAASAVASANSALPIVCHANAECTESVALKYTQQASYDDCLSYSQGVPYCKWVMFFETSGVCVSLSNCANFDQLCDDCYIGNESVGLSSDLYAWNFSLFRALAGTK